MTEHRKALAVMLGAALLWGLWWVPVRWLEGAGVSGVWTGMAMSLGALPCLALLTGLRRPRLDRKQAVGALLAGTAMSLYSVSITQTDVLRAVLLFYLAPAWSILIEFLFFGRRWRALDAAALGFAFLGIGLILRGELRLDGAGALGDWMALASGLAWSAGAALIFTGRSGDAASLSLATLLGAIGSGGLIGASLGPLGDGLTAMAGAALPLLAIGTVYMAPIVFGTIWGAMRLAPATLSFLLTAEILSGVTSSALFLDERFGWPEALGAALIMLGAGVEIGRAETPETKSAG